MNRPMVRSVLKFSWKALLIVLVVAGIIQLIQYVKYRGSTSYQIKKEVENLKREYAEDPYGGETPEETLRLFIDALKQGDTDLAAKYFVLEKQDEWRMDLTKIKEKNLLDEMVKDLSTAIRGKDIASDNVIFSAVNKDNEVIAVINMARRYGSRWKIQDL